MKKLIVSMMLLLPAAVFSQGLMDRLKKKVKDKVEQKAEQKVENVVDKGFDKAEDAAKKGSKSGSGEAKAGSASTGAKDSNSKATATGAAAAVSADAAAPIKSYSRFDFIPGEQIVYAENFEQHVMGELPAGWNTTGSGEVVTLNNYPGKWLKIFQRSFYLTSNEKEFGDNYTVEFDMIMQLKSTGYMYPSFTFGLIGTNGEPAAGNDYLRNYRKYASVEVQVDPSDAGRSQLDVRTFSVNREYYNGNAQTVAALDSYFGKSFHIAVQVQKERLRIWVGQDKVFDAPKAIAAGSKMNQLTFEVHSSNYKENEYGMYLTGLKVAKGVADMRHKLVEEGKFTTTGIRFDVNSDVIRPESFGILKDIANVLKENTDIKIKIVGHTDSDGDEQKNLVLSQKRSAAVVKALQDGFGIEASRMLADGKGEGVAVGDNKTSEGKALNRRVEFIKL